MAITDPLETQQEDPSVFLDVLAAPFRGVEGALQSAYGLGDYVLGDILPDWDTRFLGQSQTVAGGIVEGASQFLTGFIPIFGQVGRVGAVAGKVAKAGSLTQKAAQSRAVQSAVAGIATDFTVFSEQEQRLSNLIQQHPGLANPVTEFLATKEDDSVIEGRLKNALEGLGLGLAVDGVFRGIKAMKKGLDAKNAGKGADEVAETIRGEFDETSEGFINQIDEARQTEAKAPQKTVEEEVEEIVASAKGEEVSLKEEPQTLELNLKDKESVDLGDPQKSKKVKEDAEYLKQLLREDYEGTLPQGIGRADKAGVPLPDDIGVYDSDEELIALIKEVKNGMDEVGTVKPEVRTDELRKLNRVERAERVKKEIEHLPKSTQDEYMLGMADETIEDLGEKLDFADVFRTIYTEKVRKLQEVYNMGGLTITERRANVSAYLDTIWQYMSREQQLARRMGQGLRDVQAFRMGKAKINPIKEVRTGGRTFAESWLRDRKQKWIDQVIDIIERGGSEQEIMRKVLNIAENTKGGKLDMLREFWINNLLAGLPTQSVNIMGGMLTIVLDTFEKTAGALLAGRPDIAKVAIKTAVDLDIWQDSFRWTSKALKEDKQFILPSSNRAIDVRPENAITSQAVGLEEGSLFYDTFNKIAEVLRFPSRGLSSADELFKQVNARRAAKYKATIEAINNGVNDPLEIAKYVNDKLEKVIAKGGELYSQHTLAKQGYMAARQRELSDEATIKYVHKYIKKNFDKDISALAEYSKDVAEELTFTKDLDPKSLSGGFHKFIIQNPVLSFIFPFIRTPVNILTYAADRSVFGLLNPRNVRPLIAQMKSADPMVRAKALGKVSTTAAAIAGHMAMFNSFADRISGGGPRDPRSRKRLEESGWQPYSIKIGDSWMSYQRLDPLATIIGVYADMMDMQRENWEVNKSAIERVGLSLLITLQRNITNKSYLAGMEQFTQAMSDESGRGIERLFGNVAVNTTIPLAGFWRTTGRSVVGEIMDQNDVKELRNMVDKFRIYDPTGSGVRLDPRRNLLGEVKEVENTFGIPFANAVSPVRYKTQKQDLVLEEIAALDHGFSQPSPNYRGLVDLTGYENTKGQSAHDRRLELMSTTRIGGKTLRQSLEKLIKSKEYQQHSPRSEPGLPSPRIRMINSVLSKYRAKGLDRALQEYPELQQFHQQYKEVQRRQKQGQALDNLINTLEF